MMKIGKMLFFGLINQAPIDLKRFIAYVKTITLGQTERILPKLKRLFISKKYDF